MLLVAAFLLLFIVVFAYEIIQDPYSSYGYQVVSRFLDEKGALLIVAEANQITKLEVSREAKVIILCLIGVLAFLVFSSVLSTLTKSGLKLLEFSKKKDDAI